MIIQIEGLFQMTQNMSVSVRNAMQKIRTRLEYQKTSMASLKAKGKVAETTSTENTSLGVFQKYAKQYNVDISGVDTKGNSKPDTKPAGSDDISDIIG